MAMPIEDYEAQQRSNATSSVYNTPPEESEGGRGERVVAIQNPGDDSFSMVGFGGDEEGDEEQSEQFFIATEFARRSGVDTSFYTQGYLEDRMRQVKAFLGEPPTPMDGVQPTEVNQYAQNYLYEEVGARHTSYYQQFQRLSQADRTREAERIIERYILRQVPINGVLPGVYVIANSYPNEFCVNLLRLEGFIESLPRQEMNTVDKLIEMTVYAHNWEIVKRTLANLRAERERILTDQANTVEVRIGRLGGFYRYVRRNIQRMNENTRREIASIRQFVRDTD